MQMGWWLRRDLLTCMYISGILGWLIRRISIPGRRRRRGEALLQWSVWPTPGLRWIMWRHWSMCWQRGRRLTSMYSRRRLLPWGWRGRSWRIWSFWKPMGRRGLRMTGFLFWMALWWSGPWRRQPDWMRP